LRYADYTDPFDYHEVFYTNFHIRRAFRWYISPEMRELYWEVAGRTVAAVPPLWGEWGRKVRSPQGSMPANGRAAAFKRVRRKVPQKKHRPVDDSTG